MQRIERHVEAGGVGEHVLPAPVGERIELGDAARRVDFFLGQSAARHRLVAALAGEPGAAPGERAVERLHLADEAAGLAQLQALVEGVRAMRSDMGFDLGRDGAHDLDLDAVARLGLADHAERFGVEAASVEREDADRQSAARDEIGQHHVLGGEAAGEGGVGMGGGDAGEQFARAHDLRLARRRHAIGERRGAPVRGVLIGDAEILEGPRRRLGVAAGREGEGVEAGPGEIEELVAQHLADGAQFARPAITAAQQRADRIAAPVGEFREIDGDEREPGEMVLEDRGVFGRTEPDAGAAGTRAQRIAMGDPVGGRDDDVALGKRRARLAHQRKAVFGDDGAAIGEADDRAHAATCFSG